jgi:acetyltransferase-like isoleucine patch superfamily enzyme
MTFPEGLETIGDYAFSYTRIREAILPASLTTFKTNNHVDGYAFAYNQSLTTISFPASVVTIPSGTFYECNHLQPFQIPEGITTIGNSAFQGCWEFYTAIPTTVTSIGSSGFRATGLSSVVIGENVKIGKGTRIIANAYIEYAEIGERCTISPFSTIGSEPQDLGY